MAILAIFSGKIGYFSSQTVGNTDNKLTFNFWRVISHKKEHWFWKSQHVLEWQNVGPVQFSIALNCGPTFNLYLCLYSINVAIFARSPKDRTLGNFLEVCKNWRKTKPIRGLILHRHGLPHLIHQCLSYTEKKSSKWRLFA